VAPPDSAPAATIAATAIFAFVHAISFNPPFTKVKVEAVTAVPFTAAAETVTINPAGAACTEFAETIPAITAPDKTTPRLLKKARSYSKPRVTRF